MSGKFVLHLTASGQGLWCKSPTGWAPHSGPATGPIWVVTDLAEETLIEIQIPRLFGQDRQRFIARQLANRFPDTAYRAALPASAQASLMDRLAPPRQTLIGLDAAPRLDAVLDSIATPVAGVWTTSMLLAQIGSHKKLPPDLFVILPYDDGLRILFIKNRVPVITRSIRDAPTMPAQVAEIVRTLRHLENTRVLERTGERHSLLMLGGSKEMLDLLALDKLTQVPMPTTASPPADWRFALFDLAVKSPPGQLAPLGRRTVFVAAQLSKLSYVMAALVLTVGVAAGSGAALDILAGRDKLDTIKQQTQRLNRDVAQLDKKIAAFGVDAETVRQALQLDDNEIATAPVLQNHLSQLARVVDQQPSLRLAKLAWRVLQPGQVACTNRTRTGAGPAALPEPIKPAAGQSMVEIILQVQRSADQGLKAREQSIAELSSNLATLPGATVLLDPAKALSQTALTGGAAVSVGTGDGDPWCLTLTDTMALTAAVKP